MFSKTGLGLLSFYTHVKKDKLNNMLAIPKYYGTLISLHETYFCKYSNYCQTVAKVLSFTYGSVLAIIVNDMRFKSIPKKNQYKMNNSGSSLNVSVTSIRLVIDGVFTPPNRTRAPVKMNMVHDESSWQTSSRNVWQVIWTNRLDFN